MKISVLVVNYNVRYFLEVCLDSVQRAMEGIDGEIIVVDNSSSDGSLEMIATRFPAVTLIANPDNRGFSKANNQAVRVARGEYILFLNPDTVMPEDFLHRMLGYMDAHPEAGAIGPKLIDGRGQYSPDGKKSFPTLSVALFKTTGIHKIFPRSPYFNKYYAVHVQEDETASVEVLSGCCMLVRRKAMELAGGPFDEDYFMYCEDVDLAYRLHKSGYQNIYFPEAVLIHYKGESTRKATLSYVRIFNEALATFVRKHYSKGQARLFLAFIHLGIFFRAVFGVVKQLFRLLRLPMFDTLVLFATLWVMLQFWVHEVKNLPPLSPRFLLATFPVYLLLWVGSLYLNGAYDYQYRSLRVVRGMIVGTILILAYYGMLQTELRYSRAIILLTGFAGTVVLLALHELLYRTGIFKFIPYQPEAKKSVIVAEEREYERTRIALKNVHVPPDIAGRIEPNEGPGAVFGRLATMKQLLYTADVGEVIFSTGHMRYAEILRQMQYCGPQYEYKIHIPGSGSFVGSNSAHTAGDVYAPEGGYTLSRFDQQRNKRVFDVLGSVLMVLLLPVLVVVVRKPGNFLSNIWNVLAGRLTWIGYAGTAVRGLPRLRPGVLPPYFLLPGYAPDAALQARLDEDYARDYRTARDLKMVLQHLRYLGAEKKILPK